MDESQDANSFIACDHIANSNSEVFQIGKTIFIVLCPRCVEMIGAAFVRNSFQAAVKVILEGMIDGDKRGG
jgi:hypothetical protein